MCESLWYGMPITHLLAFVCLTYFANAWGALAPSDEDLTDQLTETVQFLSKGGYWGSVLVVRDGQVLLDRGFGDADYRDTPNTPETLFEIASLSKQFAAAGIYRLEMDGLLSVDDPVSRFFPQFVGEKESITIHHLLTHTSGISRKLGLPYTSDASRDELIELVASEPLDSTPGEVFVYSNIGYALLAATIEIASGMSFEDYLRTHLFAPAGLEHTGFIGDDRLRSMPMSSRLSTQGIGPLAVDWAWSWGYRGMGGVITNTHDLLRWHRALSTDQVLDASARDRLFEPFLKNYASGWFVATNELGMTRMYHSGRVAGYSSMMVRFGEEDSAIILLSNGHTNLSRVALALEELIYPAPTVSLTIDVRGYELNQYRAVVGTDEWAWRVARQQDALTLTLINLLDDAQIAQGTQIARVDVPLPVAKKLGNDLRRVIENKPADAKAQASTEIGIYLYAYEGKQSVAIEGVDFRVMPRYSGQDGDGNRIVDDRITFIAIDAARSFWPVMSKLSDQAAADLLEDIEDALGEP